MRKLLVAMLAVGSLVRPAHPAAAAPPPTVDRLESALLTVAELPGHAAGKPVRDPMDTAEYRDICAALRGDVPAGTKVPAVNVTFTRPETAMPVVQTLAATGSETARNLVAAIEQTPRKCPSVATDEVRIEVLPLRASRLGDAAAGLRIKIDVPEGEGDDVVAADIVAFARGEVFAVVVTTELDLAATNRIAGKAAARLAATLG